MKKASLLLYVLLLGISFYGFSQSTPKDFFAAKWEISITGTPNGDAKFVTELARKEGKLTGELKDPTGTRPESIPITKIEEGNNQITIYFTVQEYDVNMVLAKVDENNLKGSTMSQFETAAIRVKN
ncbi:hypothetical protein AAE02nite_14050 [Adhaeribacter aerolatus]|uniref:Uncharacterized protein n=1 Tax=Adhaeribacter aerolatus TaxID=670289 RepID=A0A512AVL0_9BACT|nr:hypothetical protein [Adhaeribacter aerolatus]GEO03741.1 hypothetical protein AAE02nite_14050 [Adhaeribacter aerolatus]